MMKMELDFAKARARELREAIEIVRAIFLAGEEPAVSRWSAVAISKLT